MPESNFFISLNSLFQINRRKVISAVKGKLGSTLPSNSLALFKGSVDIPIAFSTDVNYPEYQESYFYYLFGVTEVDCFGILDFENDTSILFIPKYDKMNLIWMNILDKEGFKKKYPSIEQILYVDEIEDYMKRMNTTTVFLNSGRNSDSGLHTVIPDAYLYSSVENVVTDILHDIIADCRVYKSKEEIEVMRLASKASCEAHCYVMENTRPGLKEMQLESFFKYFCEQNYYCGRTQPYLSICGCGPSAATLHYIDNDNHLEDGKLILTDQGHQIHHYASDITSTFPVNGKFTAKQKALYDIVLKCNRTVISVLRPGVNWKEMHLLAERVLLQGLKDLEILRGDVEEMLDSRVAFIFQPHGLGHLIGLDVHDVGGYINGITPERSSELGLKNLRTSRIMEVTIFCLT
jgi:Xaa-Pro dipeptidase